MTTLSLGQQDEARKIIGRTDGYGGSEGYLRLGEELTVKLCRLFGWHAFGDQATLNRGSQLEVRLSGAWLEGWSRKALYALLEVPPWTPDQVRAWAVSECIRNEVL
jgi:hypothetical protein